MLLISLLVGTFAAHAQDCDVKALTTALDEATPVQTAKAFNELAACDGEVAARTAKKAVPRLVPGPDAYQAAATAVSLGQAAPVIAWMDGIQPDERARAVKMLGKSCDQPGVADFFVERSKTLGEDFWKDRWYTALSACREQKVQDILWAELDKGVGSDRGRYFGILEVFSRSQGANAIPKLKALAAKMEDDEGQVNVVSAFADAARVGSVEGTDEKAAGLAVAAIVELAPTLSGKAVEQARITLQSLGAEAESDKLAGVRYKDVKQKNGRYLWGAVVYENGTCKNERAFQRIHTAPVTDPGNTWPDQLKDKVEAQVTATWEMDQAERCKGTGANRVAVAAEPFADMAAYREWANQMVEDGKAEDVKKPARIDHEEIEL